MLVFVECVVDIAYFVGGLRDRARGLRTQLRGISQAVRPDRRLQRGYPGFKECGDAG